MPCTHEINEYKQNRLPLETSSAKFSATTNFLFSLSSLHTLNKGIFHDIKTTTTEKPTWNRQEQWPMNAVHGLNQRIVKCFCFRLLTDVLTRKSNAPTGGLHFGSNSPLLTRVNVDCFGDNRRIKDTRKIKLWGLKACCPTLFSYRVSYIFPSVKHWNENSEAKLKNSDSQYKKEGPKGKHLRNHRRHFCLQRSLRNEV